MTAFREWVEASRADARQHLERADEGACYDAIWVPRDQDVPLILRLEKVGNTDADLVGIRRALGQVRAKRYIWTYVALQKTDKGKQPTLCTIYRDGLESDAKVVAQAIVRAQGCLEFGHPIESILGSRPAGAASSSAIDLLQVADDETRPGIDRPRVVNVMAHLLRQMHTPFGQAIH